MVVFDGNILDLIERILVDELINLGVGSVLLIDMAGNVIINLDDGKTKYDVYALAALAAGNFGAVSEMAKIIGEKEFSLLFHKGEKESIHFSKVDEGQLLVTVFGKDVTLGYLRLRVAEAIKKIQGLI